MIVIGGRLTSASTLVPLNLARFLEKIRQLLFSTESAANKNQESRIKNPMKYFQKIVFNRCFDNSVTVFPLPKHQQHFAIIDQNLKATCHSLVK